MESMLLVVTYSRAARQTLRNCCRRHEGSVVRRLERAALFEGTAFGAFVALYLRERHGADVQVERTRPLNEFRDVPADVRAAARAYAEREHPNTSYAKFVTGTDHPTPAAMKERGL